MLPLLLFNWYALQAQMKKWILPPKFVDYANTSATLLPTNADYNGSTFGPSNALYDDNGNVSFFVVKSSVYDGNGVLIGELTDINNIVLEGVSEIVILPVPNSCSKYYIVSASEIAYAPGSLPIQIGYATLDMTTKTLSETTLFVNFTPFALHSSYVHFAASKLKANNTRFLFIQFPDQIAKYIVNENGITKDENFEILFCKDRFLIAEMELFEKTDGTFILAAPCRTDILIANLDINGNLVSSTIVNDAGMAFHQTSFRGLEFSPNGNYLYYNIDDSYGVPPFPEMDCVTNYCFINYIDLSNYTHYPFIGLPNNAQDFKFGQIETGTDGKLYFAAANRLATLSNPDSPSAANWIDNALSINMQVHALTSGGGIEIGYLIMLPDQIDGEIYNTVVPFKGPAACCQGKNATFDKNEWTVNTPGAVTWTTANNPIGTAPVVSIKNTLTIPAGVNLSINNMTIEFGINGRIVVEPNAQLILNNTILKNHSTCNNMWQGVRVLGPGLTAPFGNPIPRVKNNNQRNYALLTINGSTIENAIVGVAAMDMPIIDLDELQTLVLQNFNTLNPTPNNFTTLFNYFAGSWKNSGGVINLGNAFGSPPPPTNNIVKNCFQGVLLAYYNNKGIESTFIGYTDFVSSSLLYPFNQPNNTISEAGIALFEYNAMPIYACNFNNLLYGIRALTGKNIYINKNNFLNTSVGISLGNVSSSLIINDVKIYQNKFNNCNIGIQADAVTADIAHNTFNENSPNDFSIMGLYIRGSQYNFEENNVNNAFLGTVGLSNTGTASTIEKNTFYSVLGGNVLMGNNDNTTIKCNKYNKYNIAYNVINFAGDFISSPQNAAFPNQGSQCDGTPINPGSATNNEFLNDFWNAPDITSKADFRYFYTQEDFANNNHPTANPQTIANYDPNPALNEQCEGAEDLCSEQFMDSFSDTKIIAMPNSAIKDHIAIYKLRYYLNKQNDTLAAINLLKNINNTQSKRLLLPYYLHKKQYTKAQQLINTLPTATTEDANFKTLYQMYTNLGSQNQTLANLKPDQINTLNIIANQRNSTAFEAQNVLHLLNGGIHPAELPDTLSKVTLAKLKKYLNGQFKTETAPTGILSNTGTLYPNPSTGLVYLPYSTAAGQTLHIKWYNSQGQQIQQQYLSGSGIHTFNANALPAGIYFYQTQTQQGNTQQGKVIIAH